MNVRIMNIRRATLGRPERMAQDAPRAGPEDDLETLEHDMDKLLADPLTPVFVLERTMKNSAHSSKRERGKYADGSLSSPVGYIEGWYVDDDLRGQGIGKALMQTAEDWARSIGLTEML